MKRIISTAIFIFTVMAVYAWDGEWCFNARLGYSIGGTMPVPMPAEIRSINSYTLMFNPQIGIDAQRDISGKWGMMTGLHLEEKGMKTDAKVKNYHIKMVRGGETLEGNFTGNNSTEGRQLLLTLPVQATFKPCKDLTLKLGPYFSLLLNRGFEGYVYDGYLRKDDPTGPKIDIGKDASTRGTYDFSDDLRRMQWGLEAGADWYLSQHFGVTANASYGFNGIFNSSFVTISNSMHSIFGTFGVLYRF